MLRLAVLSEELRPALTGDYLPLSVMLIARRRKYESQTAQLNVACRRRRAGPGRSGAGFCCIMSTFLRTRCLPACLPACASACLRACVPCLRPGISSM